MATLICLKRGTSDQWAASTKKLALGEVGIDRTLGHMKMGDGTSMWSSLPWLYEDVINQAKSALSMIAQLAGVSNGSMLGSVNNFSELMSAFPNAISGNVALVANENKLYKYDGFSWIPITMQAGIDTATIQQMINNSVSSVSGGVTQAEVQQMINNSLSSVSGGISQAQVQQMIDDSVNSAVEEKYESYGFAGMSYTINTYNDDGFPSKITYADGTVATLNYGNGALRRVTYRKTGKADVVVTYDYDDMDRFKYYMVNGLRIPE